MNSIPLPPIDIYITEQKFIAAENAREFPSTMRFHRILYTNHLTCDRSPDAFVKSKYKLSYIRDFLATFFAQSCRTDMVRFALELSDYALCKASIIAWSIQPHLNITSGVVDLINIFGVWANHVMLACRNVIDILYGALIGQSPNDKLRIMHDIRNSAVSNFFRIDKRGQPMFGTTAIATDYDFKYGINKLNFIVCELVGYMKFIHSACLNQTNFKEYIQCVSEARKFHVGGGGEGEGEEACTTPNVTTFIDNIDVYEPCILEMIEEFKQNLKFTEVRKNVRDEKYIASCLLYSGFKYFEQGDYNTPKYAAYFRSTLVDGDAASS